MESCPAAAYSNEKKRNSKAEKSLYDPVLSYMNELYGKTDMYVWCYVSRSAAFFIPNRTPIVLALPKEHLPLDEAAIGIGSGNGSHFGF